MISDTEVSKEGSMVGVGGKYEMDMSSHQVLTNPHCNGSSYHSHAIDLEKSYVFITGTDGLVDDAVTGVDDDTEESTLVLESKQVALVEDKQSADEQVDDATEEAPKSLEHGVAESMCNGDSCSEHEIQSFVTGYVEEPIDKSESLSDAEAKPVDDPVVKSPSTSGAVAEKIGDQNGGTTENLDEQAESHLVESEFDPAPVENQESQVALELASKSEENGGVSNMSLHISSAHIANGECEDYNSSDARGDEINVSLTEELQENKGPLVKTAAAVDCESQDLSFGAEDGVELAKGEVETADREILPTVPLECVMEHNSMNSNEEMHEGEAKIESLDIQEHPQLDTAPESNGRHDFEQIDETETTVSSTDRVEHPQLDTAPESNGQHDFEQIDETETTSTSTDHVESVALHISGNDDEPEKLRNGKEMPVHAESKIEDSNAHFAQNASDTRRTGDSGDSDVQNVTDSGIDSPANADIIEQEETNGVHTETKPTFQDGEAPTEAEVCSGLSKAIDFQSIPELNLKTEVHVVDYSSVSNGERVDGATVLCTTMGSDSSNVENDTSSRSDSTPDGVLEQKENDSNGVSPMEKELTFQDGEALVGAEVSNGLYEAVDTQSASMVSNGQRMDSGSVTCRTMDLNNSNIENEKVANALLETEGVQHIGDQLDGAAGGGHGKLLFQEDEAPAKSSSFDMTVDPNFHVHDARANGEKSGDASSTHVSEVSDDVDVENGSAANTELEVHDILNTRDQLEGGPAASHENISSNDIEAIEKPEDVNFNPELKVSSTEEKVASVSRAYEAEVIRRVDDLNEGIVVGTHEIFISQENGSTRKSGSNSYRVEPESSVAKTVFKEELDASSKTKPFNILVRVPRIDDDSLKERIRLAKIQVDEKTKIRDAIQLQIQQKRGRSQIHGIDFESAKVEGRNARRLVKSKRMEIDSLQSTINKAKNALSIEDIDGKIKSLEHAIQHETLPLKEEKHFIREIKQLKQMREQLSSNLGSKDEIKHALEQREGVEEHLKILRKELDALKDQVVKAEASGAEAGNRYDDENQKVRELQAEFKAADDVRQLAYSELLILRKELSKKNAHFFKYKDTAAAAHNYAFNRNTEALYSLCTENVNNFMELWNTDSEFRKDYIRCNARNTIRRLGTLDGRSLGPNEQPPILPSNAAAERFGSKTPAPAKVDAALQLPIPETRQEAVIKTVASDDKSTLKVTEHKNQKVSKKDATVAVMPKGNEHVSRHIPVDEVDEDEEPTKSAAEIELIRKAEEKRREEDEAKLKEQHWLEALEKANEAREIKRRRAEKLQMRAELKMQKEAEQKEKEKEKRLRKKERKKAGLNSINDTIEQKTENSPSCEGATEIIKESEDKEVPPTTTKNPKRGGRTTFAKQSKSKSIPPTLRNRNRRKSLQQWMWAGLACFLFVFLFWLGNASFFSSAIPRSHDGE